MKQVTVPLEVLDEAERILGNLILELGLEPGSEEYEAWERLKELIEVHNERA